MIFASTRRRIREAYERGKSRALELDANLEAIWTRIKALEGHHDELARRVQAEVDAGDLALESVLVRVGQLEEKANRLDRETESNRSEILDLEYKVRAHGDQLDRIPS